LKFELSQVDPQEIYQRIGKYWEKLVSAPYTETTGKAYNSLRQACRRNNDAVDICATLVKRTLQVHRFTRRQGMAWSGKSTAPKNPSIPL